MNRIVAGIDVGGSKKGFHVVALQDKRILDRESFGSADKAAKWCIDINATFIGVDAPCAWGAAGCGREAERQIRKRAGLHSFSTPCEAVAKGNPFYQWMLNGALLYAALTSKFPLYQGGERGKYHCFETYPHAIVWGLLGHTLPARGKCKNRRKLLEDEDIDCRILTNVDLRDAALCALTADHFAQGSIQTFGDALGGYIVLPRGKPRR